MKEGEWSASLGEEGGEECGERIEGAGESGVVLGEEGGEGWREKREEVWVGWGHSGGVEAVRVGGKGERTECMWVGEGGEEGGGDTCVSCVPPVSSHQCGPASVIYISVCDPHVPSCLYEYVGYSRQ